MDTVSTTGHPSFLDNCSATTMLADVPSDVFTVLNSLLEVAGCATINYNKVTGVGNSTYCSTLLSNYVDSNNTVGNYN